MHYAKDKSGNFPGMKKGDKAPAPEEDLKKINEEKLKAARDEIVSRGLTTGTPSTLMKKRK